MDRDFILLKKDVHSVFLPGPERKDISFSYAYLFISHIKNQMIQRIV